jgi:LPXTG-motif cell wall-anchored protein
MMDLSVSEGKSRGLQEPGQWKKELVHALPLSLIVLGLLAYWFVIADRYCAFLYYHDMGPVAPDTSPFSPVTSSRYWMAGLGLALLPGEMAAERPRELFCEEIMILADPDDPYYPLAEEVTQQEGLLVAHTLDEALARNPSSLLWIVSPDRLSDEVLIAYGLALRDRPSAVSVGMISGATLADARKLWLRASQVNGERLVVANAANPSGHIKPEIRVYGDGQLHVEPLTKDNLLQHMQQADYLTFTGHGSQTGLWPVEGAKLLASDLPDLPPVVVATGSCNTFRPWEDASIALAFPRQGAAAYAGFAYSPNEGYLIGEFDGLPFRYTWPEFPIGHVVQVQNHGTLQGFALLPFYHLLGDPRIALQNQSPYQVVGDQISGKGRSLTYTGAPAGLIPVRIPGGAPYSFVQVPGVGAAWEGDAFYNARLQMVDIGEDKFLLVDQPGGDLSVHLRARPPWAWIAGDLLTDALDNTFLYLPQTGGDILALIFAGLALAAVAWLLFRRRATARTLLPAALTGLGFAALHGLYALLRLESVTITSKLVLFSPLALASTFLLVTCGAFLFLNAQSWRGRAIALAVAASGTLAPAAFTLGVPAVANYLVLRREAGAALWNYSLGLQSLLASVFFLVLLGLVFFALSRAVNSVHKEAANR